MPVKYPFYAILAVSIWAGNTVVSKLAANAIPPGVIAFERWLIAFVIVTPFVFRSAVQHRAVIRRYLWKLAGLGLLGMAICQGLGYYAAGYTSATNMAILLSLVPLFTLLFNTCLLKKVPSLLTLVGAIISLVGIFIVLGKGDPRVLLAQGVGRGDGLMLLVVVALALYGILLKKWTGPLPAFTALYVQMGWALVFLLPGYVMEAAVPLTPAIIAMVLYAAIPASIVAQWVWIVALNQLGAARISIYMNLIPLITALIAALFLGESLHSYHFVGGGLTIAGIVLSQRQPGRKLPFTQQAPHRGQ